MVAPVFPPIRGNSAACDESGETGGQKGGRKMRVVITCEGESLEDRIDPRFGRCRTFLLVDTETLETTPIPNEGAMLGGGAGVQAAQLASQQGAEAIITGQLGPNAARTLEAAGIPIYIGATGTALEALEAFKGGRLQKAEGATVASHYGLGRGGGVGMSGGMGMGRGMQAPANPPGAATSGSGSRSEALEELKQMQQDMQKQMQEIQRRIEGLEKG